MARRSLLRNLIIVILASVVALTAVSCGSNSPGPDDIAIEWWNAFSGPDRDKLAQLTCQSMRPDLEMAMNNLAVWTDVVPQALGGLLGIGDIEVGATASDLKAKVLDEEQTSARVEVKGVMRMGAMGISGTREFNYPMNLIIENEEWVVCDNIVTSIVNQLTGMDQLGLGIPGAPVLVDGTVIPTPTLSVEQAVQATIQADQARMAAETREAILALTPTVTPTPTPLSAEDRDREIAAQLAKATVIAELPAKVVLLPQTFSAVWATDSASVITGAENWSTPYPRRWDVETGELIKEYSDLGTGYSVVLNPDGRTFVTQGLRSIRMVDVQSGNVLQEIPLRYGTAVEFGPDGSFLVTNDNECGQDSDCIVIWQFEDGSVDKTFASFSSLEEFDIDPTGEYLAIGTHSNQVSVWRVATGELVLELGHDRTANALAFSPTSPTLATGAYKTVYLWSIPTGELISTLSVDQSGHIDSIAFSPDGTLMAVGQSYTVSVFDLVESRLITFLHEEVNSNNLVAFSPDGRWLMVYGQYQTALIPVEALPE